MKKAILAATSALLLSTSVSADNRDEKPFNVRVTIDRDLVIESVQGLVFPPLVKPTNKHNEGRSTVSMDKNGIISYRDGSSPAGGDVVATNAADSTSIESLTQPGLIVISGEPNYSFELTFRKTQKPPKGLELKLNDFNKKNILSADGKASISFGGKLSAGINAKPGTYDIPYLATVEYN